MTQHLAIYSRNRSRDYIELMLSGEKTKDVKLFNKRIAPYNKLEVGDRLFIKESSGPVVGTFEIGEVSHLEFATSEEIHELLKTIYLEVGMLSLEQVERMYIKNDYAKYGTVFTIKNPTRLPPLNIFKRDRRAWVYDWELPFNLQLSLESLVQSGL